MEPEKLGEIVAPSGAIMLIDMVYLGAWVSASAAERDSFSAIVVRDLPQNSSAFELIGWRVDDEFRENWREVHLVVDPHAEPARSERLGEIIVDHARLIFIDHETAAQWRHDDSLDGLADVAFWGADGERIANDFNAEKIDRNSYGWRDLDVKDARYVALQVEKHRHSGPQPLRFALDYRPHSHHYQVLQQIYTSPTESGTLTLARSKACGFMTTWGDGRFPVFRDVTASGATSRLRIQFAC